MTARLAVHDRPGISGFVPRQADPFRSVDQVGGSDSVRSIICLRGPFTNSPENFGSVAARRARLIAGLAPWASARPQYRLKLGPAALPFSCLSDEALADLRSRIASNIRRERSRRRG